MDPKEATGVKDVQLADGQVADATGQQGVKDAQSATEQGVKENQPATGSKAHEDSVSYSRFEEVNTAKKEAEEKAARLQAQLEFLSQQQAVPQHSTQPKSLYDQTVERLGLKDEYTLTVEQQGKVFNAMFEVISASQTEANFMASHPDYADVVGVQDATGRFVPAAPLLRALQKDPTLGPQLGAIPEMQRKAFAYRIAASDPEYQASLKAKNNPDLKQAADAKAVADAAARQASISAAGTGQGTLDRTAVVQNMNDEEFAKYVDQIIARAG